MIDPGRAGQTMPTVLDVLRTHFFVPDEIVVRLEQVLARVSALVPDPVIQGPDRPELDRTTAARCAATSADASSRAEPRTAAGDRRQLRAYERRLPLVGCGEAP